VPKARRVARKLPNYNNAVQKAAGKLASTDEFQVWSRSAFAAADKLDPGRSWRTIDTITAGSPRA
jgi:hypothetical protein